MRAILLSVLTLIGLTGALQAQPVDARENLVFPVNPPRTARAPSVPVRELGRQLALYAQVRETVQKIDEARASGLGSGHPKIKALSAKLTVLKEQAKPVPSQSPVDRLAQSEARRQEREAELSREIATLKAEVAKLREELEKAQK
jgi:hypothetical protein